MEVLSGTWKLEKRNGGCLGLDWGHYMPESEILSLLHAVGSIEFTTLDWWGVVSQAADAQDMH
eukprot:1151358-Pelagomonas_calceolata.AAC.4